MFVEQRTYDLAIGTQEQWLENYEKYGLEPQTEILGRLVGYFHTDFAELNQVVHMWAYESLEDRSARRKKLFHDHGVLYRLSEFHQAVFLGDEYDGLSHQVAVFHKYSRRFRNDPLERLPQLRHELLLAFFGAISVLIPFQAQLRLQELYI